MPGTPAEQSQQDRRDTSGHGLSDRARPLYGGGDEPVTETRLLFVLGTRPEIIKLTPLIRLCRSRGVQHELLHTGQHYSESLDADFFELLELESPEHTLEIGSAPHGEQTGLMLAGIERVVAETTPSVVVVQGDTNSVLAGALAASKMAPALAHVEAGLRSFDRSMPEEVNRVLADHVADHLFAPTESAAEYLAQEGLGPDNITVTGNTIVDAVYHYSERARAESEILSTLGVSAGDFILLTVHRAENVDDPDTFRSILEGVSQYASDRELPVVYPVHPRSQERLSAFDITTPPEIVAVDPLGFFDFLALEAEAALAITDSGGVQEESCILRTPCVTVRTNTERPETVTAGANIVAGTSAPAIVDAATRMSDREPDWVNPFGDGNAAERIISALTRESDE
jgi:UDP-N-acetylglucosamine 2-epimerase (non-hydrolysing)